MEKIERFHLVKTDLRPADLLFVFGTQHGFDGFLAVIEDLWNRRMFRWAVVSGGPIPGHHQTEASLLGHRMLALGVPEDRIILEHSATNTGENVTLSLPLIDEKVGVANIHNLIVVGKDYTSVRYLMTLERFWPGVEKMFAPVHLHGCSFDGWRTNAVLKEKIMREWAKLSPYLEADFLAPWPPGTTRDKFAP